MNQYRYIAYNEKLPGETKSKNDFKMVGGVEVLVHASDEKDSLAKVKNLIKRKYYHLNQIVSMEHDEQHQEMTMTGLEIQSKLLKSLKG